MCIKVDRDYGDDVVDWDEIDYEDYYSNRPPPIISLIFNDTKKHEFPPTERSAMPEKITVFKEKVATLRELIEKLKAKDV